MKKFIHIAGVVAVIAIVASLFLCLFLNAIERSDRARCEALKGQAAKYSLWYATPEERQMCLELNEELPPDNTAYPDGQPWPYSN